MLEMGILLKEPYLFMIARVKTQKVKYVSKRDIAVLSVTVYVSFIPFHAVQLNTEHLF